MTLPSGTKLGPYEFAGLLGVGGMGEVYRARDTRLNREVAVKVLPESYSSDPPRLRRFEQEARTLAALNHPNILAIYDIGTFPPQTTAGGLVFAVQERPYIVSELLEGGTLRERLKGGALPVRKAVEYAQQIARGLAAAHDNGIVHRDLKPENIFITEDGRVKVLDFGLAKLTRPEATARDGHSAGQALTQAMNSEPGTVLGTVGYMSPEQVRGKTADGRSDLFSFGAILYEMLSGKRAFQGESPAETMSAIVKEDPPQLAETSRQVSPSLERVVRRCLEKQPGERFQSATDVAFALEAVSDSSTTTAPIAESRRKPGKAVLIAAILGMVAFAAVLGGLWLSQRRPTPAQFHQLTTRLGEVGSARFAPDGVTVIYGAAWNGKEMQTFSTHTDSFESRSLGLPSADILGISRSGDVALLLGKHRVYTWISEGTLARVPLAGGAPREVLERVTDGDISPDGTQFTVVRPADTGQILEWPIGRKIYETSGYISNVRFSPDGERIAFFDHPVYGDDRGRLAIMDRSGHKQVLTREYSGNTQGLAWTPSGKEIWFAANSPGDSPQIHAVTLAAKERLLYSAGHGIGIADISPSGLVLLTSVYTRSHILGVFGAEPARDLSWLSTEDLGGLSQNGKVIAVTEYGGNGLDDYAITFRRTDGSPAVAIGTGTAVATSPDGKWVAAFAPGDVRKIMLLPTGPGQTRNLDVSPIEITQRYTLLQWTDAGLVFEGQENGNGERAYILDPTTGKARSITGPGVQEALLSPSGKLVYEKGPKLGHEIMQMGGEMGKPLKIDPTESVLAWSDTNQDLYVWSGKFPARVFLVNIHTGQRKLWKEIVPPDSSGLLFGRMLITSDGKNYAYRYRQWLSDLFVVSGLK